MARQRSTVPWLTLRDGVHYVMWYETTPTGKSRSKRLSLGTTDAVEAQQRFAAFLSKGHAAFASGGGAAGLTAGQALDDYRREHIATKVVDVDRAEDIITHLKAYFGSTALKDIDIPASRAYAEARRLGAIGGGKRRKHHEASDSTIRRELVVLVAAANHALRWKRITANEMVSVELPQEPARGALGDEHYLTVEEWQRAIEAATGRLRDFMLLAYYTGARRASIERLTKFQVQLTTSTLNLRSPHETENQKRSKKRRPVVPLFPEIRPTVERLLRDNTESNWLFGDDRDMYRPFREHMDACGLGAKSNPHILRHTRATHLLMAGVSLWDVAKLLGDTVATVERVYGHFSPSHMAGVVGKVQQ